MNTTRKKRRQNRDELPEFKDYEKKIMKAIK
jgi:hypothetical protein